MTAQNQAVLTQVRDLRTKAEEAGLLEADPWASLDEVWKGPDVDLDQIAIVGEETITAVRQAYLEGRVDESLLLQALDLVRTLLPLALRTVV